MNTHFNVSDQELAAATGGLAQPILSRPEIERIGREIGKGLKNFGETFLKHVKDHYARKGPLC